MFEGAKLNPTGVYDAPTIAAVEKFQAKHADSVLTPWAIDAPTGYVYITTRRKINEVYCNNGRTFPFTAEEERKIAIGRSDGHSSGSAMTSGGSVHGGTSAGDNSSGGSVSGESSSSSTTSSKGGGGAWDSIKHFLGNLFRWR